MINQSLKIGLLCCVFGLHSCKKVYSSTTKVSLSSVTSVEQIEKKVATLLKQMTLEEKIGQMNQYNGFWDLTGPPPSNGDGAKKY